MLDTGRIDLSDLSHVVIDEADTLLDDSFAEAVDAIMKCIRVRKVRFLTHQHAMSVLPNFQVRGGKPPLPPALAEGTQVTFVAATVSSEMLSKIQSLVPVSPVGKGEGVSDKVSESE